MPAHPVGKAESGSPSSRSWSRSIQPTRAPRPPPSDTHEPSGKRIYFEKVVDATDPVDLNEIRKDFEFEKAEVGLYDEEESQGIKLERTKTLELSQFVESGDFEAIYFKKTYAAPAHRDIHACVTSRCHPVPQQAL